jgi:hypothetical protein
MTRKVRPLFIFCFASPSSRSAPLALCLSFYIPHKMSGASSYNDPEVAHEKVVLGKKPTLLVRSPCPSSSRAALV